MGEYVDIHGHPTWVEIVGPRPGTETVLLLHGGLSHSDELLGAIGSELADMYRVVAFDRRGHGRTADTDAPFHFDDMAAETIAVLESVVKGSAHLIGWSDGGIIALLAALRRPDLANRLVLIGTSFHVNGQRPAQPQPTVLAQFRSDYVERSPDGADHYDAVVEKSFAMFAGEPTMAIDDVAQIASPTLVLVGDDDAVELSHTCVLYESLPAGRRAPRESLGRGEVGWRRSRVRGAGGAAAGRTDEFDRHQSSPLPWPPTFSFTEPVRTPGTGTASSRS